MKCLKCKKDITVADVPDYLGLPKLKELMEQDKDAVILCKVCRKPLEDKKRDINAMAFIEAIKDFVDAGHEVYPKFACHNCGARNMSMETNKICSHGYTCEDCKKVTFPAKFGYALMMRM